MQMRWYEPPSLSLHLGVSIISLYIHHEPSVARFISTTRVEPFFSRTPSKRVRGEWWTRKREKKKKEKKKRQISQRWSRPVKKRESCKRAANLGWIWMRRKRMRRSSSRSKKKKTKKKKKRRHTPSFLFSPLWRIWHPIRWLDSKYFLLHFFIRTVSPSAGWPSSIPFLLSLFIIRLSIYSLSSLLLLKHKTNSVLMCIILACGLFRRQNTHSTTERPCLSHLDGGGGEWFHR